MRPGIVARYDHHIILFGVVDRHVTSQKRIDPVNIDQALVRAATAASSVESHGATAFSFNLRFELSFTAERARHTPTGHGSDGSMVKILAMVDGVRGYPFVSY